MPLSSCRISIGSCHHAAQEVPAWLIAALEAKSSHESQEAGIRLPYHVEPTRAQHVASGRSTEAIVIAL